jgi:hypothetical protein
MSAAAIIESWMQVVRFEGWTDTDCLNDLNRSMRTRYTLSRLGEWRNCKRPMPPEVRRYMLAIGIGVLLKKHGIPADTYDDGNNFDALADDLT